MKKTFVLLLTSCMILLSVGCTSATSSKTGSDLKGASASPTKEDAKSETSKSLVVYTAAATDVMNIVIPEFEAKTGVKVEVVTAGTGEILKRIEAEQANPLGDIEWGGTVSVIAPKQQLFESYKSANESNLIDSAKNTEGMITRNNIIPMVLLVNKKLVGDIKIEGYADLLNPKLKGKIAFPDPAKSSTGLTHIENILQTIGAGDENKGWDYIKSLTKNLDGKLLASSSAVPKGVADGEYVVGFTHEELASAAVRQGSPVEVVYMKEGAIVSPGTVQIIKGAKNMENAKKFVDFLTSKELQSLTAAKLNMRASRTDVPAPAGLKQVTEFKIVPEDLKSALANNQAWLDKFKDVYTSN
ncbi:ABC transporter substrate-binding protein [Paenibacillus aceris]|uniref:Iron(III) transport system substrate-binding protein n=1 Tax=Paenibacillus aceris TaxID=869555 RepID=A0ABS4I2A9_9BACL|nr:extracellular solute-binding protein [Paenibacillus aceris]MBP1964928.1 iron(III) transport system substrate-binding protein [Paenibacillus aceris]NHW35591.1 extracellular solute-binding protein [Paenibacillus aceris]